MDKESSLSHTIKKTGSYKLGLATLTSIFGFLLFLISYNSVSKSDANLDPWNLHIPDEFVFWLCSMFISLPIIFLGILFTIIFFIDYMKKQF